jgi:septal ring-binding cell division protein DamX
LDTENQTVIPKIKTATAQAGSQQSAPPRQSTPDNESLWTIQWVALSTEAATEAFTAKYFAGANMTFEVERIQVDERRYYILFSGRYASKALAAEAAKQTPHTGGDAPYLRTLASIAAVKVD